MYNKKSGILAILIVFLLLSTLCSVTCFATDSSGRSTMSFSEALKKLGSTVFDPIFVNASDRATKEQYDYWLRLALFLILVSVLNIAVTKTGLTNKAGAITIVIIISFVSAVTLSNSIIIFLFDLSVFMILFGISFVLFDRFRKGALGTYKWPIAAIYFALGLFCCGLQTGQWQPSFLMWMKQAPFLGGIVFGLLALLCFVLAVHTLKPLWGPDANWGSKNIEGISADIPPRHGVPDSLIKRIAKLESELATLDRMVKNAEAMGHTDEEIDRLFELAKQKEKEWMHAKRELEEIKMKR